MGDFNRTAENHHLKDFPDFNDLKIWQKRPTTTDLFLTNRKGSFTKSSTNETAMSDYRKPKFVYYRCFKSFNKELSKKNISKNFKNIDNSFEVYCDTFTNSLHCYAPSKKKKIALVITSLWRTTYGKTTYGNYDQIPFAQ